jgi:hypothetical protein
VAAVEEVLDVGAQAWMLLLVSECRVWIWSEYFALIRMFGFGMGIRLWSGYLALVLVYRLGSGRVELDLGV